jgi:sirohydrochlorin cobaltochelatase
MKTIVVLAMHGTPPKDFPRRELGEFFGLHARMETATAIERERLQQRHEELEARMRAWPRTTENDPFNAASHEIAEHLSQATGLNVIVGFNEFCAPSLDEALDLASEPGANRVIVTTLMMTRGGEHAENEIPDAIEQARRRHPGVSFDYAWPFDPAKVARFLAQELSHRM